MYQIEQITDRHLADWLEMMLLLWDDNTKDVLKAEHISVINNDNFGNFICLSDDGQAVGFINVSLRNDYVAGAEAMPVAYVEGIFVKAQYRGKGIGRMLLAQGERWAAAKGVRQIASDTDHDNIGSIAFHSAVGFAQAERVVCFIKRLTNDNPARYNATR